MAQKNDRTSVFKSSSRYVQGGETTVFPKRLGWWERDNFPFRDDDVFFKLTKLYDKRPDKLAFDYFGKTTSMWIILQYNNFVDINEEFVAGKTIRLPDGGRAAFGFLTKKTGGVKAKV